VTETTNDSSAKIEDLFEDTPESDDFAAQVDEYDLTSSPNDFNVTTIYSFIESGAVKMPVFQRNYVWDIKRASRLIESLIIGLPVPQVFLYEEGRNSFQVVDGQQRLMTIYYFIKGRFPRMNKRGELRQVFDKEGQIPEHVLNSNDFFTQFTLNLPDIGDGVKNKFSGLSYGPLEDYKVRFDLRTIRNIIVKQVKPSGDDSSIYEMFNRLNTGGTSLYPQEIRVSLYHSAFIKLLSAINLDARWRELIRQPQPDLHMRDVELLLRSVAMWKAGDSYRPSMAKFLNKFASSAQKQADEDWIEVQDAYEWFLDAVDEDMAAGLRSERGKLVVALYESVFAACCRRWADYGEFDIPSGYLDALTVDEQFRAASDVRPTDRRNVLKRLDRARAILSEQLG
jgi:hypothetical protein